MKDSFCVFVYAGFVKQILFLSLTTDLNLALVSIERQRKRTNIILIRSFTAYKLAKMGDSYLSHESDWRIYVYTSRLECRTCADNFFETIPFQPNMRPPIWKNARTM